MESGLFALLEKYRSHARSEREKGAYFEAIAKAYFEHDDLQRQHYDKVWTYADWAEERGVKKTDTGIDLVAHIADGSGYCAIQCKFFDKDYRIQRRDLDSFFTESGKRPFTRRIVIDTTTGEL
jgi:predicted helicase